MKSYLPSDSGNFLKTIVSVLASRDRAAYSAVFQSALGVLAIPLDLAMSRAEHRLCRGTEAPELPVLFVCGPPRSGTTLVAQALISALNVSYFNNLTAVFPRSPITANRVFGRLLRQRAPDFHAFYGKTRGLGAVNDGLHLWDRWFPGSRNLVPDRIENADSMREFFGAWERHAGLPLVNKNNRLNTCAERVAPHLPTAHFVCMERSPLYLAQSLLVARQKITGDPAAPYGILPKGLAGSLADCTPEVSVARQVAYYRRESHRQSRLIGDGRFRIFSYETFCDDPGSFVADISRWTGIAPRPGAELPGRFEISDRRQVEPATFAALETAVADAAGT